MRAYETATTDTSKQTPSANTLCYRRTKVHLRRAARWCPLPLRCPRSGPAASDLICAKDLALPPGAPLYSAQAGPSLVAMHMYISA